jgi:SAM-dependent methyltransferase
VTETPLPSRYDTSDLEVFTPDERKRFTPDGEITERCAWQLLYRLEPELYERLIAGECIHPKVIDFLPDRVARCVEIGAGTGRLTAHLRSRCDELVLVEPAAALRARLAERFEDSDIRDGFFDSIPLEDGWADLVVSCSAFDGDEDGLAEMERVCSPAGQIVLVWPSDVEWLRAHGFEYVSFPGEMSIAFATVDEALTIARIFYPDAVDAIADRGRATIDYDLLGMNPPRDVAYKRP